MKQDTYAPGAPCWVETWQPDLHAAARFYGALFGWRFDEPAAVVAETGGGYLTARLDGRRVAGIGQGPPSAPAVWSTAIRVSRLEPVLERVVAGGGSPVAGPLSVGADGRLAVVADPAGVAFGLWEPRDRVGAELAGRPNSWAMSSLHAPDPQRAATFYGDLFGWELEPDGGAPFSHWRLDGRLVAVLAATDGTAVPPHWAVNFAVGDVDAVAAQAVRLGGAMLVAPFGARGFRNAVVADPQGAVVALGASVD